MTKKNIIKINTNINVRIELKVTPLTIVLIKQSIFILKTVFSVISNYLNLLGITYEYLRIIKTNAQVRMMRF